MAFGRFNLPYSFLLRRTFDKIRRDSFCVTVGRGAKPLYICFITVPVHIQVSECNTAVELTFLPIQIVLFSMSTADSGPLNLFRIANCAQQQMSWSINK
jgi:hypothetical protein